MAFLAERSTEPELMDAPGAPTEELERVLHELEKVNIWLGGYAPLFDAFARLALHKQPVTIMDLGSGGGDVLRKTADWLEKNGLSNYQLIGVDNNSVMTDYAQRQAENYENLHFITSNAFDDSLHKYQPDIVLNNLFCHHFTDKELPDLLLWMHQLAHRAVIINDLHRHWFAYCAIRIITRLISRSHYVKYDGPLSVARALTRKEWERIIACSGLTNYSLKWKWAWRWQIIINAAKS